MVGMVSIVLLDIIRAGLIAGFIVAVVFVVRFFWRRSRNKGCKEGKR